LNEFLAKLLSRVWMMESTKFGALCMLAAQALSGKSVEDDAVVAAIGAAAPAPIDREQAASAMGGVPVASLLAPSAGKPFVQIGGTSIIDIWGVLDQTDADVTDWRGRRVGTSYDMIRRQSAAALADESVRGVVLRINSPGGDAMAVEQLALSLFAARQAKAAAGGTGKQVVAIADSLAASAALYIGSQADKLFTTPGGWIGSIGTICHYVDASKFIADMGFTVNTIKSHDGKDIGSPYRAMSDADRRKLQSEIDAYGAQFDAALARGRGASAEKVAGWRTNSRGYVGSQAVDNGLADAVVSDVYALIAAMEKGYTNQPQRVGGRDARSSQSGASSPGEGDMSVHGIRRTADGADGGGGGTVVATGAAGGGGDKPPLPGVTPQQRADILKADKARRDGIASRAFAFSGDAAIAKLSEECQNDASCTPEAFSERAVSLMMERTPPTGHVATPHGHGGQGSFHSSQVAVTADARDKRIGGLSAALMHRTMPGIVGTLDGDHPRRRHIARAMGYDSPEAACKALADAESSGLRSFSIMDIASRAIAAGGGMTAEAAHTLSRSSPQRFMMAAFHTSSDFPLLMANVANKTLLARFQEVKTFWQDVCRLGVATDYKDAPLVMISSIGEFQDLPEGRTPQHTTFNERQVSINVGAMGLRIGLTYQAMRNDDLGAFSQRLQMIGESNARIPDTKVLNLLGVNAGLGPTMSDGSTLYHANHLNITTQAALSYAAAWADVVQFRKKKDFGPSAPFIDIEPALLLVPVDLEPVAMDIAMQENVPAALATPSAATQRNTLRGRFKVVATPKLTGTRRYWFADPRVAPAIEVRFLDGKQTPDIVELPLNDPMTAEWQATLLGMGASAVQHEGTLTNAG